MISERRCNWPRRADARVLEALGNGGLLPPSEPVTAALAVLEDADITAWAGWSYLAQLPAEDREQVLHRYPHLVDGLVLNNPDHLERAERLLTQERLLPAAIVAIGVTATLGVRVSATSVRTMLRRHRRGPAPRRGGPSWTQFQRRPAGPDARRRRRDRRDDQADQAVPVVHHRTGAPPGAPGRVTAHPTGGRVTPGGPESADGPR